MLFTLYLICDGIEDFYKDLFGYLIICIIMQTHEERLTINRERLSNNS